MVPLPQFITQFLERRGAKLKLSDGPRVLWPSGSGARTSIEALSRCRSRSAIRRSYLVFQRICARSQSFFFRQLTKCRLPAFLHLAMLLARQGLESEFRAFVHEFEKGFSEPSDQSIIKEMLDEGAAFAVPDFHITFDDLTLAYLQKQLRNEGLDLLLYVFDSLIRITIVDVSSDPHTSSPEDLLEESDENAPDIAHITVYNHYGGVSDLKLSRNLDLMVMAHDSTVTLHSLIEKVVFPNGAVSCDLARHRTRVLRACISPNSCMVCSASLDGEIRFSHTETCKEVCRFAFHRAPVFDLQFEPKSVFVAAASMDKTASLWSNECRMAVRLFAGHLQPVYGVCFGERHNSLFTVSSDRSVRMWDIGSAQRMSKMETGNDGIPTALRVSPQSDIVVVSFSDGSLTTIDYSNLEEPRRIATAKFGRAQITDLQFSRDGTELIVGSADGNISIVSVDGLETKRVIPTEASSIDSVQVFSDDLVVTVGRSRRGEDV